MIAEHNPFAFVGERLGEIARDELERFRATEELDATISVHLVFERRDGAVCCRYVFKRRRWVQSPNGDWRVLDMWRDFEGGGVEVKHGG